MGLKVENDFLKEILYFASGAIRYIIFLMFPLTLFAQNNETVLYVENQALIFGIKHIHSKETIVKNSHKETLYILNETPFYADSSLVATISFIDEKEEHSKKTVFKTIPTQKRAATKAIVQQQYQIKYQKNTLPFKGDQLFKSGITLVVSTSNTSIVLKAKNSLFLHQTRNNSINLTLAKRVKKTTYTTTFQKNTILKEGIATYKRPPPFLLVYKSTQV